MNRLTGKAYELLLGVITGAFTHDQLRELTKFKLGFQLDHEIGPGPLNPVAFNLIAHCERVGWTDKLVDAILQLRPDRADLRDLKERLAVLSSGAPVGGRGLLQLPSRLRDFTGRKTELDQITGLLRGGQSVALRGMGGVGKTKTAVEAGRLVADRFPDAQLFVELRGMSSQPMTTAQAMAQIIRDFEPGTSKLPDDENELFSQYRRVLEDKKALILLDDAKDEAQVRRLLKVGPPVVFMVTSRKTLDFGDVESIRLGVLSPDKALELLRGIAKTRGTDDELRAIAESCGRLPLALRVAGKFINFNDNWSAESYKAALADEARRLELLRSTWSEEERKKWEELDSRAEAGTEVEAVLALSARQLVTQNQDRAARWQQLSVFPDDFDMEAAAAIWDMKTGEKYDSTKAKSELSALRQRGLVEYDEKSGRYSLHDLMRPIARDAFEFIAEHPLQTGTADRIAAAEQRFATFYCRVLAAADELYLKGNDDILRGLTLFDREEANIRHGHAWAVRHRSSDLVAAKLCRDYPDAGVYVIDLRLAARERITWLESAIVACREIGDRHGEGNALNNLGSAWTALGDARKAITFYEQHLATAREIGDRRGEGYALGNLGIAWKNLGDARKAITFHEQALVISREIGDRRGEGQDLGNLGNAWADLGDARKAITFHEQALATTREIGDRRGEGSVLDNLGNAWTALGDARKAISIYEQALVISREIGDRRGEGQGLGNLGNAWADLDNARKAITFYEQCLVIAREIGDRREEANSSYSMALALDTLGQRDEAVPLAERALTIFTEIESPVAEKVRRKLAIWRGQTPSTPS